MKRRPLIAFFLLFTCVVCQAQKPEELLNRWVSQSPIEKIYLHLDRDNYIAGEIAWFKAYLYSDFQPDTISTTVYVELLNESSVLLSRKTLPVFLGTTNGQLELPDSLNTGLYIIRAYSPTMLNQDPGFIYKRNIFIYGKKNSSDEAKKPKEKMIRLEFFPEGGNLVNGLTNTIAYKATNENGLPIAVSGKLQNGKKEILASLTNYHDGMGMFDLAPIAGEKYCVVLDGDAAMHQYFLPEQVSKGITLAIMPHPQGNYFDIQQRTGDPAFQAAYMVGQVQHHVVFRQDFPINKEELQGVINTKNLNSGILQITIFNKEGIPLAERLVFVNNKEYIQPAELIADTINFSEKAKNRFSIAFRDTVQGSFSVSISDPEYNLLPSREENIYSSLLLTSDLQGYIHNPAWYFLGDNDSVRNALDLVMMTNGWRRFKWSDLPGKATSSNSYKDPAYITLAGKINLLDSKKSFAEKQVIIFIAGADSTKSMQMLSTDKQGNFRLDSLLFFGNTRILFSDIRGKKSQYIEVKLSGDSLTRSFFLPPAEKPLFTINDLVSGQPSKLAYDYDAILKAKGVMLQGVTLKVRKKSPIQELEDKYASGLFSGFSTRTIDLVNTKEVIVESNIFDYLQFRVPGLNISRDMLDYNIYYRQAASVSAMGLIPMTIYLNEIETDASFISIIPASEVAMVKVFSSFVGAVGNGAGGVLAIYTKKGSDMYNSPSVADKIKYNGYSIIKEFYSPDYTVDKAARGKTDHRITLEWLPSIFVNGDNVKIPVVFYNNDRTKQFKIVVEGMTITGKMIFIEKTISAPQRPF